MAVTTTLAACALAVAAHYHVAPARLDATVQHPSAFPSIGQAHVPRGWLPLLEHNGFSAKAIADDACTSVVAAGWILSYVDQVKATWHRAQLSQIHLPAQAQPWQPVIRYYAQLAHVDANLVNALILQESRFDPTVVSSAGAIGFMQLTPGTAKDLGVNPWDPRQNLWGGIWYLHNLLNRFGGNLELALAAYNAGPGAVNKYGGVPPYKETQHYVPTVLRNYEGLLAQGEWHTATPSPSLVALD